MRYSEYSNIATGTTWLADTATYISGLVTPLSTAQVTKINALIGSLLSGLSLANLSAGFDVIYLLAGTTAESSLRNMVKRLHDATAQASPIFTALEGYTGDGTGSYLELNYTARTQGVNYLLDSATFGIYFRSMHRATSKYNGVYSTTADGGTSNAISISSATATTLGLGINGGVLTPSNSSSSGFIILSRNNSSGYNFYLNKAKAAITSASTKIPNQGIVALARRTVDTNVGLFNTSQISAIIAGKGFNDTQIGVITDAVEAYMDSNGKGVIA